MNTKLEKTTKKINVCDYSAKDLANFFEKYDNSILLIETENRKIECKISKNILPHLIGMHYAYVNHKNKNLYKGLSGFNMLKNGVVTFDDLKNGIKKNTESKLAWKSIKNRIEYLPMFLNTLEKNMRFKMLELSKIYFNTKLKGNYALFKIINENGKIIYPLFSLKEIAIGKMVVETFIIETDISLLGALEEEKIEKILLLPNQPILK